MATDPLMGDSESRPERRISASTTAALGAVDVLVRAARAQVVGQCRDEPTDHEIYNRFGVEGGIAYDTRPREEF